MDLVEGVPMSQKIAIIGSGVAGLTAAWLLGKEHDITLFEKKPSLGMGYKGWIVDTPRGEVRIDIPPRVINTDHYKSLFKILDEAELETVTFRQQASFSLADRSTYLAFKTVNLLSNSFSLPKFNLDTLPWITQHGLDLFRWINYIRSSDIDNITSTKPLYEFLADLEFSDQFINTFLIPMWSLMCTCQHDDLDRFPISHLFSLFDSFTNSTPSRRIKGGTRSLEDKLKTRIDRCHFEVNIKELRTADTGRGILVRTTKLEEKFDQVIIATEPHDAGKLLGDSWSTERSLIEQVPFIETNMIMHTNTSFMPQKKKYWAPVNMFVNDKSKQTSATLWMNQLEEHDPTKMPIFQSWDPLTEVPDTDILAQRTFKRSLASHQSEDAMSGLRYHMESLQSRNLWFVGSYITEGVPLLENGVKSARLVSQWIERSISK